MCLNSSVCSWCRQCRCNSVTIDVCRLKCFWKLLLSLQPYWIYEVYLLTSSQQPLHPWEGYSPNPRNSFAEKNGMSQTMGRNSYNNSNAWKMNTKVAMLFIRNPSPDIVCSKSIFLSVLHNVSNLILKTRACRHQKSLVQHKRISICPTRGWIINGHHYKSQ